MMPPQDLVGQWVSHVATMFVNRGAMELVASIPLDPSHPFFNTVKQASSNIDVNRIKAGCASVPAESRDALSSLLFAVLEYIKGSDAISDFQHLVHVHVEANRLYANNDSLEPLILVLCRTLYRQGNKAAAVSTSPPRSSTSPRSIRDTTRQTIEKSFQIASQSGSDGGDLIWPIANLLWRIYAERKLHSQAVELQKAIASLTPSEESRIGRARQTDLCQSYYWRGRIGVVLLDMKTAQVWLKKAWDICPEAWQQRRAILIRLIPVNLLLGRLPSPALLAQYKLEAFIPLIHAFKTGNICAWRRELDANRDWYRSRSIWLLLYERGEILVWRNLFRRALKTYYTLYPSATRNRCPTSVLLSAMNGAFASSGEVEDGQLAIEDAICVISSLIDHGLVLGYLSYSQQTLVMKPGSDGMGGFPAVHTVEPRAIQANA